MDGISNYTNFLAFHKPQLVLSGVPEYFWQTLSKKLQYQIFDSGLTFQLVQIDYEGSEKVPYDPIWSVITIRDIERLDSSNIYLVDHAWTFKVNSIKHNLRNIPGLLDRMCNLMQVTSGSFEERIEKVNEGVWKYANTYSIAGSELSAEDRVPVWYVLDELGSGITHSDVPNFRAVPFIYIPEQVTYTLLFPIDDVIEGELVTRNFIEGHFNNPIQRAAMLIPWQHYDYFNEDFRQEEPGKKYFLEGHIVETLPNLNVLDDKHNIVNKLKVYSEYRFINEYLTRDEFEIVNNEDDADVLWYINHFKTFKELSEASPNKYVNQFPFEYVITIKDLLAVIARRAVSETDEDATSIEKHTVWLPITFNMKTELPELVSYYMKRKKSGLDNHWICKPYNLARGLDTAITNNLDMLCRLPLSGPKIAQKYIEDPVLFERPDVGLVKFDIRYVLLLKSVKPTTLYVYNNFFLRFSNKPFELNNFDDYEKHFTVMNYTESQLYKVLCAEFKQLWLEQYPNYDWTDVERSIHKMFSDLFIAATSKEPPFGIAKSPQSRALYAADIMLSWDKKNGERIIQPKLLEINWMPDCQRACEYYPDFYNDIFLVMFLDKNVESCTKILP